MLFHYFQRVANVSANFHEITSLPFYRPMADTSFQSCRVNSTEGFNSIMLRTVPSFATAHTLCASRDGTRNLGFLGKGLII